MQKTLSVEEANNRASLTIDEFAGLTGCSRITVYRHTKSGKIPSIKIGSRVLIPRSYFLQFIEGGEA